MSTNEAVAAETPSRAYEAEVIHKVNAYTWAGRRAECAVTSEFLPSVQGWDGVTCADCLAQKTVESWVDQAEERRARDIAKRIESIIIECRRSRLPLGGARLHVGADVLKEMKRYTPTPTPFSGVIGAAWGTPVVLEEAAEPTLLELRWTISG